ncbi:hypothetical protein [Bradyrhizobium ottawaense]
MGDSMTEPHARLSAATEHDTCRFCGTVASPNDEPNCSTLQQAYAQTPTRPYGCPWFDKDSRKQWPKDRAEMSNLKDPERALVERCRADGFDYTAGCNLVDLVRRAGLTLSFTVAQQAQGCGDPSCQDPNCDYGKQDDALRAEIRSLRIDNARLRDEAAIRALASQPPAAPVETKRKTFPIPPGHEAVRDSEGRATGEVRPRLSAATDEDPTASKEWNEGCDFALEQLGKYLGIDLSTITWDGATETVEGDVDAVIGNILRAKFGEDWGPDDVPAQRQSVSPTHEDRLWTERNALQNSYGGGAFKDGMITRRIAEIDKELASSPLTRPHGGGE